MKNNIFIIAKKEYKAYFLSPIAYVYLITFLVIVNWLFFRSFFLVGQADMRQFFGMMPWIFLFFVPAVAMSKWSEERKLGTLELLFTLPIRDIDIIIAKFLAGVGLIATALILTFPIAITVALVGNPDWGPIIGGYLGLLLLGGAYLSIGLMISSLTENQIIAFILGVFLCFIILIIGTPMVIGGTSNFITNILQYAGFTPHFDSISRGVVDSSDIVYYFSVMGLFLYINERILKGIARR
ncbi:MAG: ABC transporter permease [Deltaproteobacteria bacterium]|jgi:ABC-2 type transport system permease protein|nr:ABC transporter permease [Deltaproteobacteria bacterium]